MRKLSLEAVVLPVRGTPAAWSVEAIDRENEGTVFVSVFYGTGARERAVEYADAKYIVNAIDAGLRFGVAASRVPRAILHGELLQIVNFHAPPLAARWQSCFASAAILKAQDLGLATFHSEHMRAESSFKPAINRNDGTPLQNSVTQELIVAEHAIPSTSKGITRIR